MFIGYVNYFLRYLLTILYIRFHYSKLTTTSRITDGAPIKDRLWMESLYCDRFLHPLLRLSLLSTLLLLPLLANSLFLTRLN